MKALLLREESSEELSLLPAPGSSLGGAQPKAFVGMDSQLFIAKFPSSADGYDRIAWEAVALDLAERSGITVPERWLQQIDGRQVLILKRFDRKEFLRIPFLRSMSMIPARDNETHSYLEPADRIKAHGAFPERDLHELWKRIVYTVLVSNVDGNMRNHGFLLLRRSGWVLAPGIRPEPRASGHCPPGY